MGIFFGLFVVSWRKRTKVQQTTERNGAHSPWRVMNASCMPGIILSFSHLMNYLLFKTNLQGGHCD